MWRGGLGAAYLFPALSFAGASLAAPCSVSTSRSSNLDMRISRIKCARAHLMRYVFSKNMWRRADKPHGIRDTAGLDAT